MGKKSPKKVYKTKVKGPAHTPSLLRVIYRREKGKCFWCGIKVVIGSSLESIRATKDHVLPRSRGGSNDPENVVLSCYICNHKKGNRLINPITKETISPLVLAIILKG